MTHRVTDLADPRRCKGVASDGQCKNRAVHGVNYCEAHGGHSTELAEAKHLYYLTQARSRDRLAQLQDEHDPVTSIREIIALARRLVEKRLNSIIDDFDQLNANGPLNNLQLTIERCQKSATLIEANLSALLGKPTVLSLGRLIIQIANDELQGVENCDQIVQHITTDIMAVIKAANNISVGQRGDVPVVKPKSGSLFILDNAEDQTRIAELSGHELAKTLTEDIKVQIMLTERRWNMIRNDTDLIQAIPQLNKQFRVLEKLIKSAHEIEQTIGNLLTRETQAKVAQQIIQIIDDRLEGIPGFEDISGTICQRIADSLHDKEAAKPRLLGAVELEDSSD